MTWQPFSVLVPLMTTWHVLWSPTQGTLNCHNFYVEGPNSFLAVTCRLLIITFENSLDSDQDGQNVGPHLDPNDLTLIVFLKNIFEKVILLKKSTAEAQ